MLEVCIVRCESKSGHYFVYVGEVAHASWKWSGVYPEIPFDTVKTTRQVLYSYGD